jgi:hypothetical protein
MVASLAVLVVAGTALYVALRAGSQLTELRRKTADLTAEKQRRDAVAFDSNDVRGR